MLADQPRCRERVGARMPALANAATTTDVSGVAQRLDALERPSRTCSTVGASRAEASSRVGCRGRRSRSHQPDRPPTRPAISIRPSALDDLDRRFAGLETAPTVPGAGSLGMDDA